MIIGPSLDPLKTRCLPQSPCLNFPSSWIDWDTRLRESLHVSPDDHRFRIEALRWLVENPAGIALMALVFMTVFWRCFEWPKVASLRRLLGGVLVVLAGAGMADLLSTGLKIYFGRLKPHVLYYNPRVLPALSFPSNHAFNTAFLCVLFYIASRGLRKKFPSGRRCFGVFLGILLLFIGSSRVVLGEHYPLDIVAGLVFGSLFAITYSSLVKLATSTKPW